MRSLLHICCAEACILVAIACMSSCRCMCKYKTGSAPPQSMKLLYCKRTLAVGFHVASAMQDTMCFHPTLQYSEYHMLAAHTHHRCSSISQLHKQNLHLQGVQQAAVYPQAEPAKWPHQPPHSPQCQSKPAKQSRGT